MKKTLQFLAFTLIVFFAQHTRAQDTIVNIPDENFKNILLLASAYYDIAKDYFGNNIKIDINNDGEIQQSEANKVFELRLDTYFPNIGSLVGIHSFINLTLLDCSSNHLNKLDITKNTKLEELDCSGNFYITQLDLSKTLKLKKLNCSSNIIQQLDLSINLDLEELNCGNNKLTQLDLSKNLDLEELSCGNNNISQLDVSKNKWLIDLNVPYGNLNQLDVSKNLRLFDLICDGNKLTQLDVSKNVNLAFFSCNKNQLTTLDLSNNLRLYELKCEYNQLTTLDVGNNLGLGYLKCGFNQLTQLDASNFSFASGLYCQNNKLTHIFIKDGSDNSEYIRDYYSFDFSNNPNLKYICADSADIGAVKYKANYFGYSNLIINSLCSNTSGGSFYTIKTNARFDANNNGCTAQDSIFPNLKYKISNASDFGYAIADAQGNMSLDLNAGTYTIQPIFSNPYFTISPAQANVTLPEDTLPTNFCITPIGNFNDVTIQIIPTNDARPGFSDATYKIVYTNKGTTTVSGNITFTFQDSIQDFVSSSVVPTSNANGVLTFAYSNLKPFESRSITINLRTNAPTDNPAVNGGDVLKLSAFIELANDLRDASIKDNFKTIRQTVVNSFDPNDKRCLEGDIVTPDLVGDFVNYLIRFENEGTANAINIVVTDRIDTTKFDITSLEVTASSHSNRTLITEGNKVQFIFDNINLPFTEPLKHGFITFQIKTKNNLVIGDSLKNYADIFFDYNLPITTNTAGSRIDTFTRTGGITSIRSNTNKEGKLSIYPNPSNGNFKINFESKGDFPIHIKLIDLNGRIIKSIEDEHQNQTSIDISESQLSNGLYQISIQTDKDIWQQKVMIVK
jgi:hypothetical protein